MGKLSIFEITYSNFQGVFYSGQNVLGQLTVELKEEMSMRGVRLKFEGKAYVHWTENKRHGDSNERESYTATENYFNQDILLYGMSDLHIVGYVWTIGPNAGSGTTKLAAGRHTFPFCFVLPPNLPSSFEGVHGYIRYFVKGIIDKPWKFDHSCKRPFTVIGILDLNMDPNAQMPVQGQNQKTICCLCCASGPIQAEFRLERRGYVPGEPIHIFANIQNNSSRKMDKSYIDLRMITTYHARPSGVHVAKPRGAQFARSGRRIICKEVARITERPIDEGNSFSWEGQQLVIPPLPPSYLAGCNIIDVRYILQLNVDPSGMGFDLEVPLEIIIGTIPLRQILVHNPPRPAVLQPPPQAGYNMAPGIVYPFPEGTAAPNLTTEPTAPFMPPSSIPDLPPPSYNESVFGKVSVKDEDDNEHIYGNLDYAPVYTYYDWGRQPTTMSGNVGQ